MKKRVSKKLTDIVDQFHQLSDEKIHFILKCIENKRLIQINNEPQIITDEEIDIFKRLREAIIEYIIKDTNEEKTINRLTLAGLELNVARTLYMYCENISKPFNDAKIVKKLNKEQFQKTVEFIINNFIIYQDYKYFFIDSFVELASFKNSKEASSALRFVYHHVLDFSSRAMSPRMLKTILEAEFDIPKDLTEILFNLLIDSRNEIHQGFLMSQINEMSDKVDEFTSFLDDVDEETDVDHDED